MIKIDTQVEGNFWVETVEVDIKGNDKSITYLIRTERGDASIVIDTNGTVRVTKEDLAELSTVDITPVSGETTAHSTALKDPKTLTATTPLTKYALKLKPGANVKSGTQATGGCTYYAIPRDGSSVIVVFIGAAAASRARRWLFSYKNSHS